MNKVSIEITAEGFTTQVFLLGKLVSKRAMIFTDNYSMKPDKDGNLFEDLEKLDFYGLDKLAESIDDCDIRLHEIASILLDIEP